MTADFFAFVERIKDTDDLTDGNVFCSSHKDFPHSIAIIFQSISALLESLLNMLLEKVFVRAEQLV